MPTPSVAVIQNQFRLSGRTKVVCEVINLLNELDIVPDVFTFTPAPIGQRVGRFFGLDNLRFNYIRVAPVPFRRGGLWQVLAMNRLTRARHTRYDLIVNSNNTLQGLNPVANYLHYIYYPFPANDADMSRFRESPWRFLYSKVCAWILTHSGDLVLDDPIYTISEFSRNAILRSYPELAGRIDLFYPPSFDGEVVCHSDRALRCVSVGSFGPDKNQMEQLVIASQLPDLEFLVVGNARSTSYYRACGNYIKHIGLQNVHLMTDMPFGELQSVLQNSTFFLHTMKNEPFGMSTVEAIAAGCIPVVHDSGGPREIVPFRNLRFKTAEDGARVLRRLLQMDPAHITEIRESLQQHIQQFSHEVFRERMRKTLRNMLVL